MTGYVRSGLNYVGDLVDDRVVRSFSHWGMIDIGPSPFQGSYKDGWR